MNLRVTHAIPLDEGDRRILNALEAFARPDDVVFQPIRRMGRGRLLPRPSVDRKSEWTRPCITQGILISHDGYVAPCCSSLAQDRTQPFDFGDARRRPLCDILNDFRSAPLLQLMRILGFFEPLRWIVDEGIESELPHSLPEDVCDLCAELLLRPRIAHTLMQRAGKPENRLRLAVLACRALGENEPLYRVIKQLDESAPGTEGLGEAHAFVQSLPVQGDGCSFSAPPRQTP